MKRNWCGCTWRLGIISFFTLGSAIALGDIRVNAQVTPDNTLRNENSVVKKVDGRNERIDGGATRGENLFHSFQEFNVGEGKGVYFANPEGINNILSRVTGGNPSQILGRLGVLGKANLFLLNPNGILFGSNSSLDVQGSFTATTADGIELGENGFFSAIEPQKSRLLSVSPGVTFFEQAANTPGVIVNQGNLAVGKNLTFTADNLNLQGQLVAGGNLTLQARGNIALTDARIDASSTTGNAGNIKLLANEEVSLVRSAILSDIGSSSGVVAKGDAGNISINANSVFFSEGSLLDAGFYPGGQGNGGLISVQATDLVSLDNTSFSANSLSGSISNGGEIEISGRNVSLTNNSLLNADNFGQGNSGNVSITSAENVSLANNSQVSVFGGGGGSIIIDAKNLELLAGSSLLIGIAEGLGFPNSQGGNLTVNASESVKVFGSNSNGQSSSFINSRSLGTGNGGDITINTGQLLLKDGASIGTDTGQNTEGSAGDINLQAETLSFNNGAYVFTGTGENSEGSAGDINLQAETLSFNNGAYIFTGTGENSEGNGGNVTIKASESVQLIGSNGNGQSSSFINSRSFGTGNTGDITINTGQLLLKDGASIGTDTGQNTEGNGGEINLQAETLSLNNGASIGTLTGNSSEGNGGEINLQAETLSLNNGASILTVTGENSEGNGGSVNLQAETLSLNNGAYIRTGTGENSEGNGGNVTIKASESVKLVGSNADGQGSSFLQTSSLGQGNGGELTIDTGQLLVQDGAWLLTLTETGKGGNVTVNASESVEIIGTGNSLTPLRGRTYQKRSSTLSAGSVGTGNPGDVTINTRQLLIQDGAYIGSSTGEKTNVGDVTINALESVQLKGTGATDLGQQPSVLITLTSGTGNGGEVTIKTGQLLVQDGATISTGTGGEGEGGSLTINAKLVRVIGFSPFILRSNDGKPDRAISSLRTITSGKGRAGDLSITTGQLLVQDGAEISASTGGEGDAGKLTVNALESIRLLGTGMNILGQSSSSLSTSTLGKGNAGEINLTTRQLLLEDDSNILATASGEGNGGQITINATESVRLVGIADGSGLLTTTSGEGNAGNLNLTTERLILQGGSVITAGTLGEGNAGNLNLTTGQLILQDDSVIFTGTPGEEEAGKLIEQLQLVIEQLQLEDFVSISPITKPNSIGKGGNINLQTGSLTLDNNTQISARSRGQSNAGNIDIDARGAIALNNSYITTSATQSSGGAINITAQDIRLRGDSDILTNVANGTGGGGNITLNANSVIAFDDSDIFSFASDGKGGDITLATPVFFGSRFQSAPEGTNPNTLDFNDRVDINASGAVSGAVNLPDLTFVQNNITQLPANVIDTENLIANSCVVPNKKQAGTFVLTGTGGIPVRPGDASISSYPTGEVRTAANDESEENSWQFGDPIVEPTGVYRLSDGRYIMSRECSQ